MAPRVQRHGLVVTLAALAVLVASVVAATPAAARAAETGRRGGVLLAVIGADPPSLDPHQESTFANIELVAPLYSTLLQLDPYNYPKIIGDLATDWKISPDGLTYTFKLRPNVKFHDGTPFNAAAVKFTFDRAL
ncbi:MAG: ABC transporter substrate-binding protein, partial [Candidatus Rokuibacteriota bacterium]